MLNIVLAIIVSIFFMFLICRVNNSNNGWSIFNFISVDFNKYSKPLYCLSLLILSIVLAFKDFTFIEFAIALFIICISHWLCVIDLETFKIPNKIVVPSIGVFFALSALTLNINALSGALLCFIIMFILVLLNPAALGGGDIKYCTLLGFIVGLDNAILFLSLGFIFGGLLSLMLLINKLITFKTKIPYGVFFYISALIIVF